LKDVGRHYTHFQANHSILNPSPTISKNLSKAEGYVGRPMRLKPRNSINLGMNIFGN
jgi:hypothetical protein